MDLFTLAPTDVSKMSEKQLESALCVLHEKGGKKGTNGKKGKNGGKGGNDRGKDKGRIETGRKIAGNCWNCGTPRRTHHRTTDSASAIGLTVRA